MFKFLVDYLRCYWLMSFRSSRLLSGSCEFAWGAIPCFSCFLTKEWSHEHERDSRFLQGRLFSTGLWPPRWQCGQWSDFHGWLYIISDLVIWFSYFAIPVIIVGYIYKKKYELKYTRTYFLFASFILLCGSTHLLDASMFWVPMYRFSGLILLLTGVVSLFTVYHLVKILPDAFL
jgi:hypothetical protein